MKLFVFLFSLLLCILYLVFDINTKTAANNASLNRYGKYELAKISAKINSRKRYNIKDSNYVLLKKYFNQIESGDYDNYNIKLKKKILNIPGLQSKEINPFQSNLSLIGMVLNNVFPMNIYGNHYNDNLKLIIEDIKYCCKDDSIKLKLNLFYPIVNNKYITFYLDNKKLDSLPRCYNKNLSGFKAVVFNPVTNTNKLVLGE